MKKIITLLLSVVMAVVSVFAFTACAPTGDNSKTLYVYTNAGFAPYEYINAKGEVVGVDIDVMKEVGEVLGYKVVINDIEFNQILVEVGKNKNAVGAAGMTKKAERDAVATASISYATSVQYVIVEKGVFTEADLVDGKLSISQLSKIENAGIGVQSGTTGSFLVEAEVAEGGSLVGKNMFEYKDAILASQDIGSTVGAVVIDKLPAKLISSGSANLECFELDEEPESYVLYLNKEATELLTGVNKVLQKLIDDGKIDEFTITHSGGKA
jgi:polar amino acid transport system substrate-binding protein